MAYAQPFETIDVKIIDYEQDRATISITWDHDGTIENYEIGCVSCMPNITEFVSSNNVVLNDVTPLPNTTNAMLYLIAYGPEGEIVSAKQLLIDLSKPN